MVVVDGNYSEVIVNSGLTLLRSTYIFSSRSNKEPLDDAVVAVQASQSFFDGGGLARVLIIPERPDPESSGQVRATQEHVTL